MWAALYYCGCTYYDCSTYQVSYVGGTGAPTVVLPVAANHHGRGLCADDDGGDGDGDGEDGGDGDGGDGDGDGGAGGGGSGGGGGREGEGTPSDIASNDPSTEDGDVPGFGGDHEQPAAPREGLPQPCMRSSSSVHVSARNSSELTPDACARRQYSHLREQSTRSAFDGRAAGQARLAAATASMAPAATARAQRSAEGPIEPSCFSKQHKLVMAEHP